MATAFPNLKDRVKGLPMRTAMVVLNIFGHTDFAPTRAENAIKKQGTYLVRITFNTNQGRGRPSSQSSSLPAAAKMQEQAHRKDQG